MKSSKLSLSLVDLGSVLGKPYELDWFHRLSDAVDYKNSKYVDMVKKDVDNAIGGLSNERKEFLKNII